MSYINYPELDECLRSSLSDNSSNKLPACRSLKINSELVGAVVSSIFHIPKEQLFSNQRGKAPVAFARQIAMYLTHIICGYSYTDIGHVFGRDRTTISHACQLVEDKREDPEIDWSLNLMERSILSLITHSEEWNI